MDPNLKQIVTARASMAAIAASMGIDLSTVSQWFRRGRVPAERVIDLEAITGVSRHVIRPDIYPQPKRNGTN